MKKSLYIIAGLLIIAGLAFWLSSSNLFSGNVSDIKNADIEKDSDKDEDLTFACEIFDLSPDEYALPADADSETIVELGLSVTLKDKDKDKDKLSFLDRLNFYSKSLMASISTSTSTSSFTPSREAGQPTSAATINNTNLYFENPDNPIIFKNNILSASVCLNGSTTEEAYMQYSITDKAGNILAKDTKLSLNTANMEDGTCDEWKFADLTNTTIDQGSFTTEVMLDSTKIVNEIDESDNNAKVTFKVEETNDSPQTQSQNIKPMQYILSSTGKGQFIDEKGNIGNPLSIESALSDTTNLQIEYIGGANGDDLTAKLIDGDSSCTDSLALTQTIDTDTDADGIIDDEDNCVNDVNEDQADENQNGIGDVCEEEEEVVTEEEEVVTEEDCSDPFVDTDGHWAEIKICELYNEGIVSGKDSTTFDPNNSITRAEWIKLLVLASGEPIQYGTNFLDVQTTDWYYPYISTAEALGYIDGENFDPNENINRGDAILFTIRFSKEVLYGYTDTGFSDVDVDDYYAYALIIANTTEVEYTDNGLTPIIEGYSDGTFKANNSLTRAEAVTIIQRAILAWF